MMVFIIIVVVVIIIVSPFPSLSLSLLLPSSCFCPAPAVLLPCSLQAPILHIPSSSPVPAQLLPLPTPVWQPSSSSSAPYDFFRHGDSRLLWYMINGRGDSWRNEWGVQRDQVHGCTLCSRMGNE